MSGIIGGVIDFNNKGISKNLKDSMMETINLYNVDNTNYILRDNYLMLVDKYLLQKKIKVKYYLYIMRS